MKNTLWAIARILLAFAGLIALGFCVQLVRWSLDNSAPTRVLDYVVEPVKPGQTTTVYQFVVRDKDRSCHAYYTRILIDAAGVRTDLTGGQQHTNAMTRDTIAKLTPGRLDFKVRVPSDAAPGQATVLTTMDYVCNPLHRIRPIQQTVSTVIEVL